MKVFLTGGTGVVGTPALPALVAAGHDVTALARGPAKADLVRRLGGTPVEADLFDPDAVAAAVVGHEAVVNLATHIPPLTKASRPEAWATNERIRTEGARNLVDAALAAGAARVVQESIAFPYLDGGSAWIEEDHPRDAAGPFAGAQQAEESAARFTAEGGDGVVLRFAQFYGPTSSHTALFTKAVRWGVNPFLGDPGSYTSFIHAEDAASAVVAALGAPAGTYNVVDDEPLTRAAAGRAVADALGRRRPPRTVPPAVLRRLPASARLLTRSQRVSSRRLREATGWAPAHPSIAGSWPTGTAP
jgi:nucleoside-diphosphate-sugar epimerase